MYFIECFLQNAIAIALFLFIIALMVRQDLKDEENKTSINRKAESEQIKPVTEIVYFESMSPKEKFKKITNELHKIDKLLPNEQQLNNFHDCLIQVQNLQRKLNNVYQIEHLEFSNAIKWLEKPLVSRGKYKPLFHEENQFERHNIKDVVENIQLKTTWVPKSHMKSVINFEDIISVTDVDANGKKADVTETPKSSKTDMFKLPDVKLENVFEVRNMMVDKFWPQGKSWSRKLLNDFVESIKVWYVMCMVIRFSVFSSTNIENTLTNVSKLLKKLVIVQIAVSEKNNTTTITLIIFPLLVTHEDQSLFFQLIDMLKSVF